MVGWTTQSRINCKVKFKICGTMFLHSKEGWITTISTRLPETKPVYNKGQNAIIFNWRSYWQTKEGKILQQTGSYIGIQQHMNQRRKWIENSL